MNNVYVLIPRMEVSRATAMPAWWLVAAPGPLPAVGFAHNLGRTLGVKEQGTCLVHHTEQMLMEDSLGYAYSPQQHRAAMYSMTDAMGSGDYSSKNKNALSLQPVVECNVTVSLLIAFPEEEPIDAQLIERFLVGARYGGGLVHEHGEVRVLKSLEECRSHLKSGFVVNERSDLILERMQAGLSQLDALLELTRSDNRSANPWLVPANLGFATITPPTLKSGGRESYPHAFGEPLIGLTQYVPVRDGLAFWQYSNPEPNIFTITTKPKEI